MSRKHKLQEPVKFILSWSDLSMRTTVAMDAIYVSHMYGLSIKEIAEIYRTDEEEYNDMVCDAMYICDHFDKCYPDRKGTELFILGNDGELVKPSEHIRKLWAGEPLIPGHPDTVLDTWSIVDMAKREYKLYDKKKFIRYLQKVSKIFADEIAEDNASAES